MHPMTPFEPDSFVFAQHPVGKPPAGGSTVVWRDRAKPIIRRDLISSSDSIFKSAVVTFGGAFSDVFHCDNMKREMSLRRDFSRNGMEWQCDEPEIGRFDLRYDLGTEVVMLLAANEFLNKLIEVHERSGLSYRDVAQDCDFDSRYVH